MSVPEAPGVTWSTCGSRWHGTPRVDLWGPGVTAWTRSRGLVMLAGIGQGAELAQLATEWVALGLPAPGVAEAAMLAWQLHWTPDPPVGQWVTVSPVTLV